MVEAKPSTINRGDRTPAGKLFIAVLIGALLAFPLFSVYWLVYDRNAQYETARSSIVEGWSGPQIIAGPVLAIPYHTEVSETVAEEGKQTVKVRTIWKDLLISPNTVEIETAIKPERRYHSIYEAVVYEVSLKGNATFSLPNNLERFGVKAETLAYDRAEVRFGLSDPHGLFGDPPHIVVDQRTLALQPGHGPTSTNGSGFFAWLDASSMGKTPLAVNFNYDFRGNGSLSLSPLAGDSIWKISSSWPSPSFKGGFLPTTRTVSDAGFEATYRIGNLAVGRSLIGNADNNPVGNMPYPNSYSDASLAQIELIQPADIYNQVTRSAKYGFLFIGFTFLMLLMFDVIGGVHISSVGYLLIGAALVLFFILLLALAEVIGFALAYLCASVAIIGLITAYSAAILKNWRMAAYVGSLLVALYVVLYILLGLEAYALLIGASLLFAALAGVMYMTRNLDWSAKRTENSN